MKIVLLLCLIPLLSACVAGQEIALHYTPEPTHKLSTTQIPVSLTVNDARPFVVDHDKDPSYLGHYRGGFGNTWDVTNLNEMPLADQLAIDMTQELRALGCSVVGDGSSKHITVTINNFNFDAMINGQFWYDFNFKISENGRTLSEANLKDTAIISGSFWVGAKYDMEREIPNYYSQIIKALIRANPEAQAALVTP